MTWQSADHRARFGALLLTALVAGLAPHVAVAARVTFTKVADGTTDVPGGKGKFGRFSDVALESGKVVFAAESEESGTAGVYLFADGKLTTVADTSTAIPKVKDEKFNKFNSPSLSNGKVIFAGSGPKAAGVYTNRSGQLTVIVDTSADFVESKYQLRMFHPSRMDGTMLAFRYLEQGKDGVYLLAGGKSKVLATSEDKAPGSEKGYEDFGMLGSPAVSAAEVVFYTRGSPPGIYRWRGGKLSMVANQRTLIPGTTDKFHSFGDSPQISRGKVAFVGLGWPDKRGYVASGIYLAAPDGKIETFVDSSTDIPDASGEFKSFNPVLSLDNKGKLAFAATGWKEWKKGEQVLSDPKTRVQGIYTTLNGKLDVVVDSTWDLDGRKFGWFSLSSASFNGNQIAFVANFVKQGTSGEEVVFLATIEP